jgi:hypothetical protein
MRKKFKILLPDGTKYKPPEDYIVVRNETGVFSSIYTEAYMLDSVMLSDAI